MQIKCCKGCKDRHVACHNHCDKYNEEKQKLAIIKQEKIKEYDHDEFYNARINAFYKK